MSDYPNQPGLMSAVRARNIARLYKALSDTFREAGDNVAANREQQQSAWWMAYAISLSQTPPGAIEDDGR